MIDHATPLDQLLVVAWMMTVAVVLLSWCVVRGAKNVPRQWKRRSELLGEEGFAYSASLIMTIPFVMLVFIAIIEMTALMISMIGVIQSASFAARSAIVWNSAEQGAGKVRTAAVQGMVPYAPGRYVNLSNAVDSESLRRSNDYLDRYRKYVPQGLIRMSHLAAKYAYADRIIRVECVSPDGPAPAVRVAVKFEHPFLLPFYGRMFGQRSERYPAIHVYPLQASVTLPEAIPLSPDGGLEIDYDPNH